MGGLASGVVGISPAGALGVAYFYYLTGALQAAGEKVVFVDRAGSSSAEALRAAGCLRVLKEEAIVCVSVDRILTGNLVTAYANGRLPEVVLVCSNPDQLLDYATDFVALLERQNAEGVLLPGAEQVPFMVLSANGIYFQRFRQVLIEKIEEAILLGRLPDLWPVAMPRIVGRWLRGVTLQTALREGDGGTALYRPGPRSLTTLAGGDLAGRARLCALLNGLGGWFEDAGGASPTTAEFQKAFLNLNSNLLGLLSALDDHGGFRLLRLREIYTPAFRIVATELITVVLTIGKAVRAFPVTDVVEPIVARVFSVAERFPEHVPSSLQWVEQQLRLKRLRADVPPTEAWLLNPLLHYAQSAGLKAEARYLTDLRDRLLVKLERVASSG